MEETYLAWISCFVLDRWKAGRLTACFQAVDSASEVNLVGGPSAGGPPLLIAVSQLPGDERSDIAYKGR